MSVINTQPLAGASGSQATGYNLTKSLRFRSSASAWLQQTPAVNGNRKTFTWSFWIKRGTLGVYQRIISSQDNGGISGNSFSVIWDTADKLYIVNYASAYQIELKTTQVFRDPAAWYHVTVSIDTTQSTASNRVKMYVNGNQITSFDTATYPSQNTDLNINDAGHSTFFGRYFDGSTSFQYLDGYLSEVNFIDGQQLTPSSFGETDTLTGVWKPKRYTGTYGTNGFYLPFTDVATTSGSNAGLGKDFSGNGNYWTTNNISVTAGSTYDSMTDVPTLTSATAANYAVLNPLDPKNGTLYYASTYHEMPSNDYASARSTIGMKGGKWYWEVKCQSTLGSGVYMACGIGDSRDFSGYYYVGSTANGYSYDGRALKVTNNASTSFGATYTLNDIIGVAFDADNGTLEFFKNGTSQGTAFTGIDTSLTYYATHWVYTSGCIYNFGQQGFTYTPPTGFKALNTYNLPTSTIVKGNTVMDATTFNSNILGDTVVNSGFKPDLVWMKSRSNSRNNELIDSCRGGAYTLFSNLTNAEASDTRISSFNSNGFTYTTNSNSANIGETDVAWQWQAGQGTTSSNTNGSITSTVSVNPTSGFSVVTYPGNGVSGATIGHGLGVAPAFFIVKNRSAVSNWTCYHQSLGNTYGILLNSTNAADPNTYWMNTSPTSTVFKVDSFGGLNASGNNYVAYCWAEIAGFSKFGSFTGNGSTNGPFVYTGFKPKFILVKRSDTGGNNWRIMDTTRDPYNYTQHFLYPDGSYAEDSGFPYDLVSNGFKVRASNLGDNGSGSTYIYAAFAENPFKNSLAR